MAKYTSEHVWGATGKGYVVCRQTVDHNGTTIYHNMNSAEVGAQLQSMDNRIRELEREIIEWEASFRLYDGAMLRATKMWREAGGDNLIYPSADKMMVWLLGRIRELEIELRKANMAAAVIEAGGGPEEL